MRIKVSFVLSCRTKFDDTSKRHIATCPEIGTQAEDITLPNARERLLAVTRLRIKELWNDGDLLSSIRGKGYYLTDLFDEAVQVIPVPGGGITTMNIPLYLSSLDDSFEDELREDDVQI